MKMSVVIPAYNEEESIFQCVKEFQQLSFICEVVVVDNNSIDNTVLEAKRAGAKVISENYQGFGASIATGIKHSIGDYVCICEADQTFIAKDLMRLVTYLDQFEVVLGSRTSNSLIWSGAYMPGWVRWGNWFVGKLVELLFNGPSFTDIGCTFKVMSRDVATFCSTVQLTKGSRYNQEFLVFLCLNKFKAVELPVNYRTRVGDSKITGGKPFKTFSLGLEMIAAVLYTKISPKKKTKLRVSK